MDTKTWVVKAQAERVHVKLSDKYISLQTANGKEKKNISINPEKQQQHGEMKAKLSSSLS